VKCPVAPLEFCFLADWHFRRRGIREQIDIEYVTSLDGAFTKQTASRELSGLLAAKDIHVTTEFNTGQVDGAAGRLISWDERATSFDLLVTIPLHGGSEIVARSPGLGDELGFVAVDGRTLQADAAPNVFAIGDATNVPTSKAGSVAHFEGETLVANVRRFLDGRPLEASFDGHTNCFIETGFGKALLIDFNYETEPLPGWFPEPHLGPLPLLKESRLNHFGKLAFEWLYWHVLLAARPMPGISAQMQLAGKDMDAITMERVNR
jgi:sulfide:quinone oxidoreductase